MPTIGQQFKQAREKRPATVSQAAEATRIKYTQIEAMERDDFSRMGAPIYAKGFIRIYSEYLGLDPAPLLREYEERNAPPPDDKPVLTPETAPRVFRKKLPPPELAPPAELPFDAPAGDGAAPAPVPRTAFFGPGPGKGILLGEALLRKAVHAAVALAAVVLLVLAILWIVRACSGAPSGGASAAAASGAATSQTDRAAPPAAPAPAPAVVPAEPPRRPEGPPRLIGEPPVPYLDFDAAPAPAPAPAAAPARGRRP